MKGIISGIALVALTSACAAGPPEGLTVEQLFENDKAGRVTCGDVVVVTGTTAGVGLIADSRNFGYTLTSSGGASISVESEAGSWPPVGPMLLVKGRLQCGTMLHPDGSQEKSLDLFEMDRRVDVPPGTATFE